MKQEEDVPPRYKPLPACCLPYSQLTHINYAFLSPKEDRSFHPINNGWKL